MAYCKAFFIFVYTVPVLFFIGVLYPAHWEMFNEAEQSSLDELVIKVRKIIFFEILPIIYEELNPF